MSSLKWRCNINSLTCFPFGQVLHITNSSKYSVLSRLLRRFYCPVHRRQIKLKRWALGHHCKRQPLFYLGSLRKLFKVCHGDKPLNVSDVRLPQLRLFHLSLQEAEWHCDEFTKGACFSRGKSEVSLSDGRGFEMSHCCITLSDTCHYRGKRGEGKCNIVFSHNACTIYNFFIWFIFCALESSTSSQIHDPFELPCVCLCLSHAEPK